MRRTRRSSRKRLASINSNQCSPNTQTLPTLTLFLPLQVHGSWLVFLQSSHWKSDTTTHLALFRVMYVVLIVWIYCAINTVLYRSLSLDQSNNTKAFEGILSDKMQGQRQSSKNRKGQEWLDGHRAYLLPETGRARFLAGRVSHDQNHLKSDHILNTITQKCWIAIHNSDLNCVSILSIINETRAFSTKRP